jgi:hypothetical protein
MCVSVAGTCTKLSAAKTSCQSPSGLNYPIARRGHTAVVYDNSMYVFGGYVDMKGSSNELWRFRFGKNNIHSRDSLLCVTSINLTVTKLSDCWMRCEDVLIQLTITNLYVMFVHFESFSDKCEYCSVFHARLLH